MTEIKIPNLSLVVLIGVSGSGKSTFAEKHFLPTEVLSSDFCRGLVSDDPNNQAATNDAFDLLDAIARKRLARGHLTVIDATNVQPESRKKLVALAREFHVLPVAIVLNLPEKLCVQRNQDRSDRNFGARVIRQQRSQLRQSIHRLKREGFRTVCELKTVEEVESATIQRVPLWNDKRDETGPFDFIGDVHGCCDELQQLFEKLGYERVAIEKEPGWSDLCYRHPDNRKAVFVGDLVDRGPRVVDSLSVVRNMVEAGTALCVPGNHDDKLLRKLSGRDVQVRHGLAVSLEDIEKIPEEEQASFKSSLIEFLNGLISHYVLDEGKVVVAHAGMKQEMQGRGSGKVRSFALYGETTGEKDEFGLPVRNPWAEDYRGDAMVVYGHTPVSEAEWLNKTINIDTGCVFGGKLTAMRYPELELVSVNSIREYCPPSKPFQASQSQRSAQQEADDLLDATDVIGKRFISTRLRNHVTIREENATAALEVMSRFAVNPKWLIYLPPTMAPSETSTEAYFLEHPRQAFDYFRSQGLSQVICEEKHMGSRAIAIVCRDESVAVQRFGVEPPESSSGELGIVYTRTGRRFFQNEELERELLQRVNQALTASDFWERLETDWVCLDCELMPWSAKAQQLLKTQYAAVGAAAGRSLSRSLESLKTAASRLASSESDAATQTIKQLELTQENAGRFVDAYRRYCWKVDSVSDLQLAPFHILATEGKVHTDRRHPWHMEEIEKFCQHDSDVLFRTQCLIVDLQDEASVDAGIAWWSQMTDEGGEGMVVKPIDMIVQGKKGLVQPAVKCRGKEYLRIIYGPDYDSERHLNRLRNRHLGRKRSLALREFALGVEGLERFVNKHPLRQVHECVFGVLALESEPVDPRL